jgi:comEA protein
MKYPSGASKSFISLRTACAFLLMAGILSIGEIAPQAFATGKKPPSAPVNLNTATSEQLQTVPGIGPATAEKILQMKKSYGAFKSVDDLLAIKGIGKKRLDKMRKYLTVGKSQAPPSPKTEDPPKSPF